MADARTEYAELNTINYNGVLSAFEFRAKVKMLCYEREDTVSNVEKHIGAYSSYIANLHYVSDYDIRRVAQYFGMSKEQFINMHTYEVLKLPAVKICERDYTTDEWAIISRVAREARYGGQRN